MNEDDLNDLTKTALEKLCDGVRVSKAGTKKDLIRRLIDPDQARLMVGNVPLPANDAFPLECLKVMVAKYETLGHATGKNISSWRAELEDAGMANGTSDSQIYGHFQHLGSARGPKPETGIGQVSVAVQAKGTTKR